MITVHHLEQSRSLRVVWLLEELGLPYQIEIHRRDPKTMLAPKALRAIHPLGKAPIVVDDGLVLIESAAILEILVARHGATSGLIPQPGTPEHRDHLTFIHFAEGSMMPPLLLRLVFSRMKTLAPRLLRPMVRAILAPVETGFVAPNIKSTLDFLEGELARRPWFAGATFGIADIQMGFPILMARSRGGLDDKWPKLMGFLETIEARPAYRRALAKIGE